MYNEFNKYIYELENGSEDFWYDVGVISASEMLSKFTDEDWENLLNELPKQSLAWKRKVVYCIDNNNNPYELKCLLALANTEDEELFEMSVDSLREFINEKNLNLIKEEKILVDKVEKLVETAGVATKRILDEFLIKIKN